MNKSKLREGYIIVTRDGCLFECAYKGDEVVIEWGEEIWLPMKDYTNSLEYIGNSPKKDKGFADICEIYEIVDQGLLNFEDRQSSIFVEKFNEARASEDGKVEAIWERGKEKVMNKEAYKIEVFKLGMGSIYINGVIDHENLNNKLIITQRSDTVVVYMERNILGYKVYSDISGR